MLIMAVGAAESDDGRDGVAATARPSGTLLIVRAARRHIAQGNAGQDTQVDANLHRRRARKNVDGGRSAAPRTRGQGNILEEQFILFGLRKDILILRRV